MRAWVCAALVLTALILVALWLLGRLAGPPMPVSL